MESDGNFCRGACGVFTDETVPAGTTLAQKYDWLVEICENKGDYSFIFTSANRGTAAGKTFYPEPPSSGAWHGLLAWPTNSNYQTANVSSDGTITLNGMVSMSPEKTGSHFITSWADSPEMPSNITAVFYGDNTDDATVAAMVHSVLSQYMGFSGSAEDHIFTNAGIFYPQRAEDRGSSQRDDAPGHISTWVAVWGTGSGADARFGAWKCHLFSRSVCWECAAGPGCTGGDEPICLCGPRRMRISHAGDPWVRTCIIDSGIHQ